MNKINLFKNLETEYYLSIDKNINSGSNATVYHSTIKSHHKIQPKFKFFMCMDNDTDENDKIIENDVIVKVIKNSHKNSLIREIDNLLELQNEPHIIHILKFENKLLYNKSYFVTECCKGGDLYDYYLNNAKIFSEDEVKIITLQLISAIRECHKHRIVHGDIKLENIGLMIKNDITSIKLLDFGGSIKIKNDDDICDPMNMHIQASPHYIPPELIFSCKLHEKDLIYIDFWELGIVMYALLTKSFPYKKIEHIGKIKWSNNSCKISPEMKSIVEKLLVKNPLERCNLDLKDLF